MAVDGTHVEDVVFEDVELPEDVEEEDEVELLFVKMDCMREGSGEYGVCDFGTICFPSSNARFEPVVGF